MRTGTFTLLILVAGALQIGASSLPAAPPPPGFSATSPSFTTTAAVDSMNEVAILDQPAGLTDQFGRHVGISGDTAIVGAHDHDPSGLLNAGAAYIFERDVGGSDNWGRVKKLTADDAAVGDQFGIRVDVSGDTAVVGAFTDEFGAGTDSGSAYVFQRDVGGTNNWGQVKKLTANDPDPHDQFGKAVAIDGDTIVVGAFAEDPNGIGSAGSAYVFERNQGGGGNWGQVKKLVASDRQQGDQFGISVGVSGDAIVVGALGEDPGGILGAGSVYVFERNQGGAGNWGQVKKLVASDRGPADQFGGERAVAIGGDTVVVGAFAHDHGISNVGSAYVFQRNAGGVANWGEVKELLASDRQQNDQFGISVGVSSVGLAVVGAFGDEFGAGPDTGSAYLFDRNFGGADNWGESRKLVASDPEANDWFGWSTAVSGNAAVVGAPFNIKTDPHPGGSAYVFDLPGGEGSLKFFISDAGPLRRTLESPAAFLPSDR